MELAARQQFHACTGDLEEVVLFEFLKHTSFDLDELVGNEECQQRVVVRIDSNVQRDHLVYHHECVRD